MPSEDAPVPGDDRRRRSRPHYRTNFIAMGNDRLHQRDDDVQPLDDTVDPERLAAEPDHGSGRPMANISDSKPFMNIVPFGMCMSLANPTVAAATAAALGVLVPMPCTPVTAARAYPAHPR